MFVVVENIRYFVWCGCFNFVPGLSVIGTGPGAFVGVDVLFEASWTDDGQGVCWALHDGCSPYFSADAVVGGAAFFAVKHDHANDGDGWVVFDGVARLCEARFPVVGRGLDREESRHWEGSLYVGGLMKAAVFGVGCPRATVARSDARLGCEDAAGAVERCGVLLSC